jgi:hypothetical protein
VHGVGDDRGQAGARGLAPQESIELVLARQADVLELEEHPLRPDGVHELVEGR